MKTCTLKIVLLFLFGTFLSPCGTHAGEPYEKVISKEFAVSPNVKLIINNKFGDVQCTNWQEDRIAIEVTIRVKAPSADAAQKLFDRIQILISGSSSQVEASTDLSEYKNPKGNFSIDYNVKMPYQVQLNLINKFGDAYVEEVRGKSSIKIAHGNCEIGKLLSGDNLLEVKFGNATIESMKGAVVSLEFSNMDVGYVGSMKLESKYSNIRSNKVIVLEGTVEGGELDLEESSVITLNSKFSQIHIVRLAEKIDLTSQFGSCEIDEVSTGIKSLTLISKFGNIEVNIPSDVGFTLDAETSFGNLDYPESNADFSYRNISGQNQVIRGTFGTNPTAIVKIRSEHGNVSLR